MKADGHTIEGDPRWARVLARDKACDGQFFYSVATTGVFCKPSCPSRPANPAERPVPCDDRGLQGGRLPALQAMQAGPAGP